MESEDYPEEQVVGRNYFSAALDNVSGLMFRIGGEDLIEELEITLKGGKKDKNGNVDLNPRFRMMTDEGVHAARFTLLSHVNKVNHLTRYENEERIMKATRNTINSWIFQVTLNRKRWKVDNPRAIVRCIEAVINESNQRGASGFEAELITKSHNVSEVVAPQMQKRETFLNKIFGGRR